MCDDSKDKASQKDEISQEGAPTLRVGIEDETEYYVEGPESADRDTSDSHND